jgi:hypothetical protein
MTDPLLPEDEGGTELTAEEHQGLIPSYITLRSELNEATAGMLGLQRTCFSK